MITLRLDDGPLCGEGVRLDDEPPCVEGVRLDDRPPCGGGAISDDGPPPWRRCQIGTMGGPVGEGPGFDDTPPFGGGAELDDWLPCGGGAGLGRQVALWRRSWVGPTGLPCGDGLRLVDGPPCGAGAGADNRPPRGEGVDWIAASAETLHGLPLRDCVAAVLPPPVFCSMVSPGGIPPHRPGLPAHTQAASWIGRLPSLSAYTAWRSRDMTAPISALLRPA